MEYPFYGNYWSHPTRPLYSSNMRGIPVQPVQQKPAGIKPSAKVVQIPVHFVNSDPDEPDSSGSALRIQKVFRGFLVRKSVKRIMSIRKEVEDVERKLLCRETAELICRDERERLRVNETLMSLLLKLDSIRGVNSGVRECRKAVIRKAISLQEKVDSTVSTKANQIAAEEKENQCNDSDDEHSESANQTGDVPDSMGKQDEYGKLTNQSELYDEKTPVEGEHDVAQTVEKCEGLQEVKEEETDYPMGGGCMEESVEERGEVGDVIEGVNDEDETRTQRLDGEEESRRNRELLEKMVRIMNELCQRNEIQTLMLNSLTQRVDQLEKTFLCDRLKRKNKKKRHPA